MGRNKCSRQIPKNTVNLHSTIVGKIMWMLLLSYNYFSLQDLHFYFVFPFLYNSIITAKYEAIIPINTAWCHKIIRTFFSVFLNIRSLAGVVNILSYFNSLALFCHFPFITGYVKNLHSFKHWFKLNLSDFYLYVNNAEFSKFKGNCKSYRKDSTVNLVRLLLYWLYLNRYFVSGRSDNVAYLVQKYLREYFHYLESCKN